ncbi:hypothetical protein MHYP_G00184710 [Metynnis hypsauchen]
MGSLILGIRLRKPEDQSCSLSVSLILPSEREGRGSGGWEKVHAEGLNSGQQPGGQWREMLEKAGGLWVKGQRLRQVSVADTTMILWQIVSLTDFILSKSLQKPQDCLKCQTPPKAA